MTRIGVISNPGSGRNRRGMEGLRAVLSRHPEVLHAELDKITDIGPILGDFARRGIELVVISGGDGTVQAVITELLNGGAFDRLPLISILPSGMTNLIARDVGLTGHRERALERLIERVGGRGSGGTRLTRSILSMTIGEDTPPVHGLLFGTGAFYRGTLLAREKIHPLGIEQSAAAGLTVGLFCLRLLFGRSHADPLLKGDVAALRIDGNQEVEGKHFLLLATTLDRLLLGIMPFWGGGEGAVRYTAVTFPPKRLGRALLPVLRGRPRRWMPGLGYRSGIGRRVEFRTDCPVVLDGEFYTVDPGAVVVLESIHRITFLR
ncbi:diacylglycerol kinase family protein [Rhodospirillaceae bacterium SYSU D60014]|uniref:diacylglycerol/lipid kinase family protein n=1 Tax=Virgifigura deserti TaxID=2268457 RepID=UPI000E671088